MSLSKLGWVLAGIAAGAAAAWSFIPAERTALPPPVVAEAVPVKALEVKEQRPAGKKRIPRMTEPPREETPVLTPSPDVSACGAHAVVTTEVIAHVRPREDGKPGRVSVSARPDSPELVTCVREKVSAAKLSGKNELQTFRYAFKPQ